jgi:hypothetical protein
MIVSGFFLALDFQAAILAANLAESHHSHLQVIFFPQQPFVTAGENFSEMS